MSTTVSCPIDSALLTVPPPWNAETEHFGERQASILAWVLFHIRDAHGLNILTCYIDHIKAPEERNAS